MRLLKYSDVVLPTPRFGFRGIVHLTARDGAGRVIFRHAQPNLITDEGLRLLRSTPLGGNGVLQWAILGTRTADPHVDDDGHDSTPATDVSTLGRYLTRAMPTPDVEWCGFPFAPPQLRSARGWSSDDNDVNDIVENVWDGATHQYIRLVRSRHFTLSDALFPLGDTDNLLNGMTEWGLSLTTEADNLAEICFAPSAPVLDQSASLNCGEAGTLNWIETQAPTPFIRVLFMDGETPFTVGWGPGADVNIPDVGTLTVAYEVRMYLDLDPVVDEITIAGTPTDIQTGFQRLGDDITRNTVYTDLIQNFGAFESQVTNNYRWGTSNTPPANLSLDMGSGSNPTSIAVGDAGDHYRDIRMTLGASIANDGVGSVMWGNLNTTLAANRQPIYTVFDPPVDKTNLQRAVFHLRHSWGRA